MSQRKLVLTGPAATKTVTTKAESAPKPIDAAGPAQRAPSETKAERTGLARPPRSALTKTRFDRVKTALEEAARSLFRPRRKYTLTPPQQKGLESFAAAVTKHAEKADLIALRRAAAFLIATNATTDRDKAREAMQLLRTLLSDSDLLNDVKAAAKFVAPLFGEDPWKSLPVEDQVYLREHCSAEDLRAIRERLKAYAHNNSRVGKDLDRIFPRKIGLDFLFEYFNAGGVIAINAGVLYLTAPLGPAALASPVASIWAGIASAAIATAKRAAT